MKPIKNLVSIALLLVAMGSLFYQQKVRKDKLYYDQLVVQKAVADERYSQLVKESKELSDWMSGLETDLQTLTERQTAAQTNLSQKEEELESSRQELDHLNQLLAGKVDLSEEDIVKVLQTVYGESTTYQVTKANNRLYHLVDQLTGKKLTVMMDGINLIVLETSPTQQGWIGTVKGKISPVFAINVKE